MVINGILNIKTIYFIGLVFVVALMPWSTHWCANAITVTLVLGLLSSSLKKKVEGLKKNSSAFAFVGLYLLYVVGIVYTSTPGEAWASLEQKLFLIGLPLIISSSVCLSKDQIRLLLLTFVFSILTLTVFSIGYASTLLIVGEPPLSNFDIYTYSNFENTSYFSEFWNRFSYISLSNKILEPTYFSLYLAFSLSIIIFFETSLSIKIKWVINSWFSLFILLLASRMGILLLGTILLLAIFFKLETSLAKKIAASLLAFASMASLIFLFPVTRFRMIEEPLSTSVQLPTEPSRWNSTNLRMMEWKSGLYSIQEAGFFGTGTGGTWSALRRHAAKQNLGVFSGEFNLHNQYLETMLEIGAIGLIVLLLSYISPLLYGLNTRNYLLLSLGLIVCVSSLTESILERAHGLIFFTSFVAILMYSSSYETA